MVNQKAQSGIIGAVLLILIVLVAALVVMGFVVPFVKNQLSGGDCLEVTGKMEITNNLAYTCYNSSSTTMSVQVHYGAIENITNGFQISVESGGSSKSFKVIPGTGDNVTMLSGNLIVQPTKNGENTYLLGGISIIPETIEIYPILKTGQACDASDSLTIINNCF